MGRGGTGGVGLILSPLPHRPPASPWYQTRPWRGRWARQPGEQVGVIRQHFPRLPRHYDSTEMKHTLYQIVLQIFIHLDVPRPWGTPVYSFAVIK